MKNIISSYFKNVSNIRSNAYLLLIITVIYFAAARISLILIPLNSNTALIWPPTGISIAAFLIWGRKIWPAIFIGSLFFNLSTTGNVITSVIISFGNSLEGVIAVLLVRNFIRDKDIFYKPVNIFKYIIFVGILSTNVSALIGVTAFHHVEFPGAHHAIIWLTWWLGNLGGVLIVTPLIIILKSDYKFEINASRLIEAAAVFIFLVLASELIFKGMLPYPIDSYPFISITIPVWIALRFTPRETILAIFILTFFAVLSTLQHAGPFVNSNPELSLIGIQVFIAIMFLTVMPLTAIVYQHKVAEDTLLRDIDDRKRTEEVLVKSRIELKNSLEEKELLLKEIHHRVKNNLQIISSLLSLQSDTISNNEILEIFNQSKNRIRTLALAHEKLYHSKDLSKINFQNYVDDLVSSLTLAYNTKNYRINIIKEIESVNVNIDEVIALGLILNELITNSLKHAFKIRKSGEILIHFCMGNDGNKLLMVKDNGEGLPDKLNFTEINTLGLSLVAELVCQLKGDIQYKNNNGAEFNIYFN